jgi:hypothetical protein
LAPKSFQKLSGHLCGIFIPWGCAGEAERETLKSVYELLCSLSMKELLVLKHPTAWMEFESGQVTEEELMKNFFLDGRDIDIEGLKDCMIRGYSYLEGVEPLLSRLQSAGFNMHAFSNYPSWYQLSPHFPYTLCMFRNSHYMVS